VPRVANVRMHCRGSRSDHLAAGSIVSGSYEAIYCDDTDRIPVERDSVRFAVISPLRGVVD
jgi:hypothetical protein